MKQHSGLEQLASHAPNCKLESQLAKNGADNGCVQNQPDLDMKVSPKERLN